MNAVYRSVMLLFGAAVLALAAYVAVYPRDVASLARGWLSWLDRAAGTTDMWVVVAGLASFGLLLVVLGVADGRGRGLIVNTDAGPVQLEPVMVAEQVRHRLESLDGVRDARVDIVGRGRHADVRAAVEVDSAALDSGLAPRLARAVREALEGGTGVRLGRLSLDVRRVADRTSPEREVRAA